MKNWFQYITCYSLSMELAGKVLPKERFNTSHVTLYLWADMELTSLILSFNTSHVTLYHGSERTKTGDSGSFNTSHVTLYRFGKP